MAIGSLYIAMMITNWNAPEVHGKIENIYRANSFGFWTREVIGWVAAVLYVWTLIAPRLFPNRNFVIE
jgi:carbon starvation protein CstA